MKKCICNVLVLVFLLNIFIANAQAASYVLDNGFSGGKWSFTTSPIIGEVTIQEVQFSFTFDGPGGVNENGLPIPPEVSETVSHVPTKVSAYLVPTGTEITVAAPGHYYDMNGSLCTYDGYSIVAYDLQGYQVNSWPQKSTTPIVVKSGMIYCVTPVIYSAWEAPSDASYFYVSAINGDDAGNPVVSSNFTDVAANAYYADAVKWAVDKGVTSGTSSTTFSPDTTCTTGEILTFLWRANGSPAPASSNNAIPAGKYYTDAANWALEKGLTDSFDADTPATRAATVTYLWKLAGKPDAKNAASFTDVAAGAAYADAVAWAVEQGITGGTGANRFSPDVTCTRGQIVTFLYRDLAE